MDHVYKSSKRELEVATNELMQLINKNKRRKKNEGNLISCLFELNKNIYKQTKIGKLKPKTAKTTGRKA